MFLGQLDAATVEAVDDLAADECGQQLLGIAPGEYEQLTTPYRDDSGSVVFSAADAFGEGHCEDAEDLTYRLATAERVVVRCDEQILLADLAAYEVVWATDVPGLVDVRVGHGSPIVVTTSVVHTPAAGLEANKNELHVTGHGIEDGATSYDLVLQHPDGGSASVPEYDPEDLVLASVSSDGLAIVSVEWPDSGLPNSPGYTAEAFALDGSGGRVLDFSGFVGDETRGPYLYDWEEADGQRQAEQLIDPRNGRRLLTEIDGRTRGTDWFEATASNCSPFLVVGGGLGEVTWYIGRDDGDTVNWFYVGDKFWGEPLLTPTGVFLNRHDGDWEFHTPEGVAWTLPVDVVSEPRMVSGELWVTNPAGDSIRVDTSTGTEAETARSEPSGVPTWLPSDQMLVEDQRVIWHEDPTETPLVIREHATDAGCPTL
ncbi:MAG: hypothetical protein GY788_05575 [bacterium]|nr:hypothetical protein [bacterium]